MRQLDDQASSKGTLISARRTHFTISPIGCLAQILPTLQKYIELRRRLAAKSHANDPLQPGAALNPIPAAPSSSKNTTKSSIAIGKAKVESSRDMAQQIALLSEEILRASQEKVNIAQANCDSVFVLNQISHLISSHTFGTLWWTG
jgi:hypothetical protein